MADQAALYSLFRGLTWGPEGMAVAQNDLGDHSCSGSSNCQGQDKERCDGEGVCPRLFHAAQAPQPMHDVGVSICDLQARQALAVLHSTAAQIGSGGPHTWLATDPQPCILIRYSALARRARCSLGAGPSAVVRGAASVRSMPVHSIPAGLGPAYRRCLKP